MNPTTAVSLLDPITMLVTLLYALMGVVLFWVCFLIVDKIVPCDLWAEIVKKQNVAVALVAGAMCLGISMIVAAAIQG